MYLSLISKYYRTKKLLNKNKIKIVIRIIFPKKIKKQKQKLFLVEKSTLFKCRNLIKRIMELLV